MDFAVPVKTERKRKESSLTDLERELKKQWNMKVTVIPILTGELE